MKRDLLRILYHRADGHYGNLHWWPGGSALEIIIGAILTQNTAWTNVEKSLCCLKKARMLSLSALRKAAPETLAPLIRSSGYFNQKSLKLKNFIHFLDSHYKGNLAEMGREETEALRSRLLSIKGIGPETADSILLYAFHKPVFVIDAYTRRILGRLGILIGDEPYDEIRLFFESRIGHSIHKYPIHRCGRRLGDRRSALFNQYHALIVNLGKDFCRARNPRCAGCPLKGLRPCKREICP
jgi:endonuclease III related protein